MKETLLGYFATCTMVWAGWARTRNTDFGRLR